MHNQTCVKEKANYRTRHLNYNKDFIPACNEGGKGFGLYSFVSKHPHFTKPSHKSSFSLENTAALKFLNQAETAQSIEKQTLP